jgi:N-acetylmuramic acid 6-phosphate etherase
MLDLLLTERRHPDSTKLDALDTPSLLNLINTADAAVPGAVAREIPRIAAAVEAIATSLVRGGRLWYQGSGTSGRLGVLDASECPPTFGVPQELVQGIIAGGEKALKTAVEGAEDDVQAGADDLVRAGFERKDALVGISASGRTPYVLGAVRYARQLGAITCGISCSPDSELSRAVDFPIEALVGPEILTGSTRMRAGTATKVVLNMISTAVMVRLGYVYENLMVNVQPSNVKLEDRARRIIQEATGVAADRAGALLEEAGRSVPVAIVMHKRAVPKVEAEQLLARAGGRIREALQIG